MKDHEGYNPAQMPGRETQHAAARSGPTVATSVIDVSLGIAPAPRATRGQRVTVWVDIIKADKREEWERLIHEILAPAAARADEGLMTHMRFLEPREPNDDGTWTYVMAADPRLEGAGYDVRPYIVAAFGEDEADAFDEAWNDCHARGQRGYDVIESAW